MRRNDSAIHQPIDAREFIGQGDLEAIDRSFQAFLDQITAPGAKTRISQGQSPIIR